MAMKPLTLTNLASIAALAAFLAGCGDNNGTSVSASGSASHCGKQGSGPTPFDIEIVSQAISRGGGSK